MPNPLIDFIDPVESIKEHIKTELKDQPYAKDPEWWAVTERALKQIPDWNFITGKPVLPLSSRQSKRRKTMPTSQDRNNCSAQGEATAIGHEAASQATELAPARELVPLAAEPMAQMTSTTTSRGDRRYGKERPKASRATLAIEPTINDTSLAIVPSQTYTPPPKEIVDILEATVGSVEGMKFCCRAFDAKLQHLSYSPNAPVREAAAIMSRSIKQEAFTMLIQRLMSARLREIFEKRRGEQFLLDNMTAEANPDLDIRMEPFRNKRTQMQRWIKHGRFWHWLNVALPALLFIVAPEADKWSKHAREGDIQCAVSYLQKQKTEFSLFSKRWEKTLYLLLSDRNTQRLRMRNADRIEDILTVID